MYVCVLVFILYLCTSRFDLPSIACIPY